MPYTRSPFDLLWNFSRKDKRHVYLVVGDGSLSEALTRFQKKFKITPTFVNLTPYNSTVERLKLHTKDHEVCVFYIKTRKPISMGDLHGLLRDKGYPEELLDLVNKVYRFHGTFDQYALAA